MWCPEDTIGQLQGAAATRSQEAQLHRRFEDNFAAPPCGPRPHKLVRGAGQLSDVIHGTHPIRVLQALQHFPRLTYKPPEFRTLRFCSLRALTVLRYGPPDSLNSLRRLRPRA
jgi:hypothetical protein